MTHRWVLSLKRGGASIQVIRTRKYDDLVGAVDHVAEKERREGRPAPTHGRLILRVRNLKRRMALPPELALWLSEED